MNLRLPDLRQGTLLGYYANSADPVQTPPNAASDQYLHCLLTEISMEMQQKSKQPSETSKTRNGIIQMMRMDKSSGQKRVKFNPEESIKVCRYNAMFTILQKDTYRAFLFFRTKGLIPVFPSNNPVQVFGVLCLSPHTIYRTSPIFCSLS